MEKKYDIPCFNEKCLEQEVNKNSKSNKKQISNVSSIPEEKSNKSDNIQNNEKMEIEKFKDNGITEKILVEIKGLNQKMDCINDLYLKRIQNVNFEKDVADRLHKELQEYKNDVYFQFIKPLILEFINIRESMKRTIETFGEKNEEEKLKIIENYVEEIQIILENNDIEIYETDIENNPDNRNVNLKKQKIIKKIETADKEMHGKIHKITSNGYMYKGRVISHEKVDAYIYKKTETEGE